MPQQSITLWDGLPPDPSVPGRHLIKSPDGHAIPYDWIPDAREWRIEGFKPGSMRGESPEEMAGWGDTYLRPVETN